MRRLYHRSLTAIANASQRWFVGNDLAYKLLLTGPLDGLRWRLGAWRAWAAFERAYRTVPAYRVYVDEHGGPPPLRLREDGLPDLSAVPETDKRSYVERYPHAQRCAGGRIPTTGVVVDESSGSSGTPTSWVRGPEERWTTTRMLQLSYRSALGDRPTFVVNAFALGAWATGLNVSMSLADVCMLKSTGPDVRKIVGTLREFGPDYDYVIMGYPPFLKTVADSPGVDWDAYRVRAVFGGEALSESMRRYLLRTFDEVLGSYGASDLEINMAAESRFTVRLRAELERDPDLRARLTDPRHDALPMVFQYNPLAYHLVTNPDGELVVTLNRPTTIAPKVRYNIHDLGHVARFGAVEAALGEHGLGGLVAETRPLRLPLLFLYGRSDQSVDYYGANVTPDSVREILDAMDDLTPHLDGFRLIAREEESHRRVLEVAVELAPGSDPAALDAGGLGARLFERLADVNGDFANAWRNTASDDQRPRLTLHRAGTGPFAGGDRIKRTYIGRGDSADGR